MLLIPSATWANGISEAVHFVNRFYAEQEKILKKAVKQSPQEEADIIKSALISAKRSRADILKKIESLRWSETSISKQTNKARDMLALYTFTYISTLSDIVGRLSAESRGRIEFAIDKSRQDRRDALEKLDIIYGNERDLEAGTMKKWYESIPVSKVPEEAKGLMKR